MSDCLEMGMLAIAPVVVVMRVMAITVSLVAWHLTQRLLARRNPVADAAGTSAATAIEISDGIHRLTARFNRRLLDNPRKADALLIASSAVIDLLGFYLLVSAIFGPTIEPFFGLFLIFGLRQICQAFCPLPPPLGMIWRSPGFPSLLVTYGTSCDLFFSGHTAIAVYGCAVLAGNFGLVGVLAGCVIAVFEISAVLVLRAHYTMDVFTGAITALYVHHVAASIAPHLDGWIGQLVR